MLTGTGDLVALQAAKRIQDGLTHLRWHSHSESHAVHGESVWTGLTSSFGRPAICGTDGCAAHVPSRQSNM